MKKTLVALFALSACAQAVEPFVYDSLLTTTTGWEMGSARNRANFVVDTQEATLSLANSNWSQSHAIVTLERTLTDKNGIALDFSVTMNAASANAYTIALVGTTQAITIGTNYQGKFLYGTSDNTTANAYTFGNDDFDDHKNAIVTGTEMTTSFAANTEYVITGTSSFDTTTETYSFELSVNGESVTIDNLSSLDVQKIVFMGDAANVASNVTFSDLSISGAPEPATATLSLLALAGLAARRRRH